MRKLFFLLCLLSGFQLIKANCGSTVTPTIHISCAQGDTICNGANSVTFNAAVTNGGASPVYQWMVNSVKQGTSSNSYTGPVKNSDLVWCVLTSNAPCAFDTFAVSNQVRMTVDEPELLSISPDPDCKLDTLFLSGASSASRIIWYLNGYWRAGSSASNFQKILRAGAGFTYTSNPDFIPEAMVVDSAGNIYLTDKAHDRVVFYPAGSDGSTRGKTVAGGNGSGSAANQFFYPASLCFDTHGNLYVTDLGNNSRIQKFPAGFDSTTHAVTVAGGATHLGGVYNASALCTDRYDNLYVLDGYIRKFSAGAVAGDTPTIVIPCHASAMCVNKRGDIYISDKTNDLVSMFAIKPDGTYDTAVIVAGGNGQGVGLNQLFFPLAITTDAANNLYVADIYNHRVQMFPPGSTSATSGVTAAQYYFDQTLYVQQGLYLDGQNNIYIADLNYRSVWEIRFGSFIDTTYKPTVSGIYKAKVYSVGGCRVDSVTAHASNLGNFTPAISQTHTDSLHVTLNAQAHAMFQWSLNGQVINGDTGVSIAAPASGNYSVMAYDTNGCRVYDTLNYVASDVTTLTKPTGMHLYPNPGNGEFVLLSQNIHGIPYAIYDLSGKVICEGVVTADEQKISLTHPIAGNYILVVKGRDGNMPLPFTVVK